MVGWERGTLATERGIDDASRRILDMDDGAAGDEKPEGVKAASSSTNQRGKARQSEDRGNGSGENRNGEAENRGNGERK